MTEANLSPKNTTANSTQWITGLQSSTTVSSVTEEVTTASSHDVHAAHILAYVLVPLGSLAFIALLSFVVVFILRKSKLDKLRHHLMPLYNFDPAEEEGDWESELLEEDKEQQIALHIKSPSPTNGPQLKFNTDLSMDL